MGLIKVMDENLSNKIAAGEVVEKVSSVVKELVENSLDAGSTNIEVSLVDAGIKEIKVIDNGKGMDKSDAVLAFTPHATSKIKNENDLFFINTLGFRGEALPSIASVSEVLLDTSNGIDSTLVNIKGGKLLSKTEGTMSKGTKVIVKNLFYNTPARLKFLKSYYTELNGVVNLIEKLALSHPGVSFKLNSDNKDMISTSGSNDLLKTIHEIYGYNVSKNMVYIEGSNNDYDINGYVSNINIVKSTKKDMIILVNGRIVNNSYVNKVIKDAYHTYLAVDKYPIVVINILVDPTIVDVNIHPTKQDIKFSKMDTLEDILFSTIRDRLMNINNIFKAYDETDNYVSNEYSSHVDYSVNEDLVVNTPTVEKQVIEENKMNFFMNEDTTGYETVLDTNLEEEKPSLLHPIGLAMGTYLFATDESCVYMIDIHAANERINYEKNSYLLAHPNNDVISPLIPMIIELPNNEFIIAKEKLDIIKSYNIDIEEFGINSFRVISHPTWFPKGNEEKIVRRIIEEIVNKGKDFSLAKFNNSLAALISCKMSVKANTRITKEAQEEIINELRKCNNPFNCPHGRPTIINFTTYEIEKMFKRVV